MPEDLSGQKPAASAVSPSAPAPATSAWSRLLAAVPRAALGNLIAKLLIVGLGLGITVTVARQGPKVQGAFALFGAVESALLTLFSGLGLWLARQLSRQAGGEVARSLPLLQGVLRAVVALGLLASCALLAVAWWADSLPYSLLWLLAIGAPFLLLVPTATGLWLGEGRMWPINLAQVAAPALVLSGLMAIAWFHAAEGARASAAVLLVLVAWVGGKSLVGVVTAFKALADAAQRDARLAGEAQASRLSDFWQPSVSWWSSWPFVATIGLTNVVSLLNYRASLFLVEHFHGLNAVGTYSIAVTVAELLWLLSSSVTVSAYARIGHPDRAVAAAMTVQAVRINVLATLVAAPVLLVLAWWGVPLVMGPAYAASLMPLAALLPGVAAYAAASSLSAFYTNHLGRPQLSGGIAATSLAISFGLGCVLVPRYGATGAGVASSLGYILAIMAAYGVFLKHAQLPLSALWRGVK